MKIMIFWLDFAFTCLLLTAPFSTSEITLMLVKYEKAKERNSKKETINRPDYKKQKNNKGKDSEPKWAGTVSATFQRWEHTDYREAGEDNYRRL